MDTLVKMVADKTGVPEPVAGVAVKIVLDYLKDKLPAQVATQIDTVVGKSASVPRSDGLSSFFGKKPGTE